MLLTGGRAEGEPERSESSREQTVPTRAKHLGSKEGHGFLSGRKPLERRGEVERFHREAQERRGWLERVTRPLERMESSEERSSRALGVERDLQGMGSQAISSRG
jgi:hypothetical protein